MKLTTDDEAQVKDILQKLGFLEHLTPEELRKLIAAFDKVEIGKGVELMNQGTVGKVFYVLAAGSVGVYLKRALFDKKVADLGPGTYFGEMALIDNTPRESSVVCEADGVVYTLIQNDFNDIIMRNPWIAHSIRKTAKDRKKQNHDLELKERLEREKKKEK